MELYGATNISEASRRARIVGRYGLALTCTKYEAGFFYGNRYAAAWWKNFSSNTPTIPKDLVDAVDGQLSQHSPNNTAEYIGGPLKFLNKTVQKTDAPVQ